MALRNDQDNIELPLTILGTDWSAFGDSKEDQALAKRLRSEQGMLQEDAARRLTTALRDFAKDQDLALDIEHDDAPAQLALRLAQPEGDAVLRARVALTAGTLAARGTTPAERRIAPEMRAVQPLKDGSVLLQVPAVWRRFKLDNVEVTVTGGNGSQTVQVPLKDLRGSIDALMITLPKRVDPAPLALLSGLDAVAAFARREGSADMDVAGPPPRPVRPEVALGEGDCELVFRTDPSQDRFPYGVFFRLTDPGMSTQTLARGDRQFEGMREGERKTTALRPVYPDELQAALAEKSQLHLVDRVAIDRPISVEAFGRAVSGVSTPRRLPMAATLAIGYVVHLAQRWTQKGLALGDLVYSLPLAPGEQQRIAVVERSATMSVIERESLDQREDLRFDEVDTSSAQATFAAGFNESAQGGSSYDANSSSFSIAAAAGGGGVFPFGAFAGGVATSYGSASASGSTSTWMQGARQSTSNASQSTQAAVSRRASASRQSSRAAVRLATATETTQVTTKVITNHNRTRALTMQYWEVLRLFDVQTVVEDVSLVCLVPLDIVDFLPAGQPARLATNALDRGALLTRYQKLLAHSDVLTRVVPWRLRRGLQALNDFVADPRAVVQAPTGDAMQTVAVRVLGGFTQQDEVWVQLLMRSGVRTGSVRLSGSGGAPLPTGASALGSETELFARLRAERSSNKEWAGSLVLPASVGLHDVVGLVLTRRTRRLDYTFAPPSIAFAQSLFAGQPVQLAAALANAAAQSPVSRSFGADRVTQEIGDLTVARVDATIGATVLVGQGFAAASTVPDSGLTVSATRQPPTLSYDTVLDIERTLQWVLRNTMRCSTQVVAALTAEERAVLLERYSVTAPQIDANGVMREGVPLLSCITNNVLGFFGNCIVMPFQIPLALAEQAKVDSGRLQRALKRFHTEAFDHSTSIVALPTRGVLGEAVLGRCPSAEKIDLTRFWNWKDSPADEATAIGPITLPSGSLLTGAEAPSKLTGLAPIINNFSTQGPGAVDTALAQAIAGKAIELGKPFDIGALTNAGNLKDVVNKTTDTAESARKDALAAAKELAIKAMETHAASKYAKAPDEKDKKEPGKSEAPVPPTPTDPPTTPPKPAVPPPAPAAKPAVLKNFFDLDKVDLVDATGEGRAGQTARIDAWVTAAKAFKATTVVVRGYASPEGTTQRNHELVRDRAKALAAKLRTALPGVTVTEAVGGIVSGPPSSEFPELRRADADITGP
jgi:outer membrane protein OmpA-like peptidoglycan-associated protein